MRKPHPFGTLANPGPLILRWLNRGERDPENKVEKYIRTDTFAWQAFKDVVGEGAGDKTLICLLCVAVRFDLNVKRIKAVLTQAPGKSLRTLANFPMRLEAMAEKIKRVNSSSIPDLDDSLPRRSFTAAESHFDLLPEYYDLPMVLRCYADYVKIYARNTRHGRREMNQKQVFNADWALYVLREVVRATRRKPMYVQMADLLTATARALGEDKEYYPDTLKMRLQRKREALIRKLLQRRALGLP